VRVRTALPAPVLPAPVLPAPELPLVRVRTGAAEPLLDGAPVAAAPLVRVRTGVPVELALVGAATALTPLARVRGADGAPATATAAPAERTAPLTAPLRGRGGRSWRTM